MALNLTNILKLFIGDKNKKDLKAIQPYLESAKKFESELNQKSDDQLRELTNTFKTDLQSSISEYEDKQQSIRESIKENQGLTLKERKDAYDQIQLLQQEIDSATDAYLLEILPQAFAVVKETAKRFAQKESIEVNATAFDLRLANQDKEYVQITSDKAIWSTSWDAMGKAIRWDMVHYDVQLIGGTVLHQGKIAEMATGEGKTLVATLPVYLNALTGRGLHVITVNDYLAKRDAAWMGPFFEFHGLSIDCIDHYEPHSEERKAAYNCDITYGTNNEFGFDYLRDNMVNSMEDRVQRELNYAIVDEVDSVLIDDARTPLIISGPVTKKTHQQYEQLKPNVEKLVQKQRQSLTEVFSKAKSTIESGNTKEGGKLLYQVHRGLPKYKPLIKFLSVEGMKQILQKTESHYLQDNQKEMPKIDKHLLFVIDEKNNTVELTDKGIAELSEQTHSDMFVLPDLATEVDAIDKNESLSAEDKINSKEELYNDFGVKSERIHTLNQLLKAYALFEKDIEYVLMEGAIKIVDEQTGRVMDGRRYSDGLHQAIEAKEGVKVQDATQTVATITLQNYFRMYRKLAGMTGTAETEAGELWNIYKLDVVVIPTNRPIQRNDFEDKIYKTAREKFNAIIDEIVEITSQGRPVLVGTTSVDISELLGRMLKMRGIKHNVLNAKLHKKEAEIVAQAGQAGMVTIATNMAGRGTDIKLTDEVKQRGGLAIIGTERHDSRRVDRQLRGRSGRQGDPGSSQFYISLEDNLMRLFATERMAKMMDRMGLKEGEVIQHSLISKSIERAQKKVEENSFGVRKRLLEYDNVMNSQREVIYKRRTHAISGEQLNLDYLNAVSDAVSVIVQGTKGINDYSAYSMDMARVFSMASPVSEEEFASIGVEALIAKTQEAIQDKQEEHFQQLADQSWPVIKMVYETNGSQYKNIAIPVTDGQKGLQIVTNLEKAYNSKGATIVNDVKKSITIALIDDEWKEHLRQMDELRTSVQNAVYEQKDPLLIYKFESFDLFKHMLIRLNQEIITMVSRVHIPEIEDTSEVEAARQKVEAARRKKLNEIDSGSGSHDAKKTKSQPIRSTKKYGRNDEVKVANTTTGEEMLMKFKKAEKLLASGEWQIK